MIPSQLNFLFFLYTPFINLPNGEPVVNKEISLWCKKTQRSPRGQCTSATHQDFRLHWPWSFGRFGQFRNSRWWKNGIITCYNPYKWPYKWVTGVITLLMELIFLMKKVGNHQVIWRNISQLQSCSTMIVSINIMSYFSESPSSQSHVFSCETWSPWLVKETRLNVLVPVTSHILRGILFTPIKQHRDRLTRQNPCFSRTRAGKTKKHNECVWEWYQV